MNPLVKAWRSLSAEVAWRRAEPVLRSLPPKLRYPAGVAMATKAGTSFGTVMDLDWYQRNGYNLIAQALGGGYSSFTGQVITADRAFETSCFYAGVKIIAEDIGRMPFDLFRRTEDRSSIEDAIDHPAYPVLRNLWNPEVSAGDGTEAVTAQAVVTGTGYAKIQRDSTGNIQWLFPLDSGSVRMDRNAAKQLYYLVREESGMPEKTYTRDDIFNLPGFTLDGYQGDNLLARAKQILGLTAATQEHAGRWFANDAAVGLVFERPLEAPDMSDEDLVKFKAQFKAWHQGLSHVGEPAVVQEGMKLNRIMAEPEKTQLIEQRKFQVIEVCRILRMKPHKLADLEQAHLRNIAEENIDYISQTLGPWMSRWSRAVYRCLLSRDEQLENRLMARHNIQSFLEGNFEMQANAFAKLLEKGVYSINEVRKWYHMNPIDGGDAHYVQLNMQAVSDTAGTIQDTGPKMIPVGGQPNGKGGLAHASYPIT